MPISTSYMIALATIFLVVVTVLAALNRKADHALSPHGRKWRAAWRVRKKLQREDMRPAQQLSYLRKIDPYVFEELVLMSFREAGYAITRNRRYSCDGGVDGRMKKDGVRWYVQCKRYGGYICARHVDEFSAVCERAGVHGVFVHTGKTGGASKDVVRQDENITIVSGGRLLWLVVEGKDVLN